MKNVLIAGIFHFCPIKLSVFGKKLKKHGKADIFPRNVGFSFAYLPLRVLKVVLCFYYAPAALSNS